MTTTLCSSQSSILPKQNNKAKIRWYLDSNGDVRYDMAKPTLQILENKAKKFVSMERLYKQEKELSSQAVQGNLLLQVELFELNKDIKSIKVRYDTLVENYMLEKRENVKLKDINSNLSKDLKQSKKDTKKYKKERNWSLFISLTAVIFALITTN